MKKSLALLGLMFPLLAAAQSVPDVTIGTWTNVPSFSLTTAVDLIDTESYVYALSGGTVLRADKQAGTVDALSRDMGLNDIDASGIYYNYGKRYLLITYTDGNVDFLYDDGHVINLSDIKDATMSTTKTINDVTFSNGSALLATSFGYVFVDDNAMRVSEYRNYDKALTSVAQVGGRTFIATADSVYQSTGRRDRLDDFTNMGFIAKAGRLRPISDTRFFVMATGKFWGCTLTADGCTATSILSATANSVQPTVTTVYANNTTTDGSWLVNFRASKYYYVIEDNAKYTKVKTTTNNTTLYSRYKGGDGTYWQINEDGIARVGEQALPMPDGLYYHIASANMKLYYSLYNRWDNSFYVTTADQRQSALHGNVSTYKHIFRLADNAWTDATPSDFSKSGRMTRLAFIPGRANSYFFTDRSYNVYRVVDGRLNATFTLADGGSGAFQYGSQTRLFEPALQFDRKGNLWCLGALSNGTGKAVSMLPADKVLADQVSYADWIQLDPSAYRIQEAWYSSTVSSDNVLIYANGKYEEPISGWRQKPGSQDSDHEYDFFSTTKFTDQNGQGFDWYQCYVYCTEADSTGNIWVGSSKGMFYFKASEMFEENARCTVARPTGDDVSPYGQQVTCIGVDPYNRKWVGTSESGLYVLSPDGWQVLAHYDVENSALPSSTIFGVSASADKVIAVTEGNQVVEFDLGNVPAATVDYTAVTAAPLFVEPGYTGFVTIGQVEPGALVRITDRDGNIVREFTATGSQVAWDTCLTTGERVPTGVYDIYAGGNADQLPATPQARVKIVK